MTGPQRYVARAIAALTMEGLDATGERDAYGARVDRVAELSEYPDLVDRDIIGALVDKGYAYTWAAQPPWGTNQRAHQRVKLTAKGWMEAMGA